MTQVFVDFDAGVLHDLTKIFDEKPSSEWTTEEIHHKIFWDEPEASTNKEAVRRAVFGSTALVGFIAKGGKDLWVASAGDREACTFSSSNDYCGWILM